MKRPRITARMVVGALSGLGGAAAASVGAVSLTRIAGDYLGFPAHLEWTLTAAVDIGAAAGAVMWSTSPHRSPNRATGVRLNIACSVISAVGVGLDHATHAEPIRGWQIAAFLIGAFLPLLSTWLVHALARLTHGVIAKGRAGRSKVAAPAAPKTVGAFVAAQREQADEQPDPDEQTGDEDERPDGEQDEQDERPPARKPINIAPALDSNSRATAWAIENYPVHWKQVMAAADCSRSTAFRAIRAAKEAAGEVA
jgi:hypothetical protein